MAVSSPDATAASQLDQKSCQSGRTSTTHSNKGVSSTDSSKSCCTYPTRQPRGMMTRPESGASTSASIRIRVDLPQPFGPQTHSRTPESMSSEKSDRMSRPPKAFERF